jgi:hypothetical protein
MISIILFWTLEAQMGIRATYSCPQEHLTTNHTTEAFVDNSTNFINGSPETEPFTETQLGHWLHLQNEACTSTYLQPTNHNNSPVSSGNWSPHSHTTTIYTQSLRTDDRNIMSEIMKIENSPIVIQRVNQCRLFLQVTWLSEMTDPQGTTIIPGFLQFTRKHNDVSRSNLRWPIQALPPKKSWEVWKRLIHKSFLLSKLGRLGKAVLEESLGCLYQHMTITGLGTNWEEPYSKNTFILNENRQIHYTSHTTRHQIKVNQKDILHKVQPILHGYPITIWQSMSTNLVFARPHRAYKTFELHKPRVNIVRDPYKVAMLKYLQYRPVHHTEMEVIEMNIIGVTSKQWGSRANFGWCTMYQGDNQQDPLGSGASSVMTTSSCNDRTRSDLHAIQAALIYLQMRLQPVWKDQVFNF